METRSKHMRSSSVKGTEFIESLIEEEKFTEALAEIERAEKVQTVRLSPGEEANVWYLASLCLYKLGRYKEALAQANPAFETLKDTSENEKVAQIQEVLGRIHFSLGDLRDAELYARDAISTYRRIANQAGMVKTYNLVARIYFVRCEFEKSIEYLDEARKLSEKLGDSKAEALICGNLGRVYTLSGEWRKAERNLEKGFKYHQRTEDSLSLCKDLLSLGFVACLRRDFQRSKRFLARAFELAQGQNFLREKAIYHEYAGQLAHASGDLKSAEKHFLEAIEISREAAPEGDLNNQAYRLLAELQAAREDFDQALVSCQKSLEVSASLSEKIEEGAAYRILGQIYSAGSEKDKSSEYFTKSISILQQVGAKYELAKTFLEAGRSHIFDYYKRLGFLSNAESLFRSLDSKYHLGLVNSAITDLLVEAKDYSKAQVFLTEAETLFKQSNDQKELRGVRDLRRSIEEVLSQSSMIAKSNGEVTFENVLTQNTEMTEIVEKLKQVMDYDISILLEGETGSGKDLIAKAVHYSSSRKEKRFVAINCAALPESLLENELFGHKRGAYTGADKDQPGLFEEAEGGTLYLDQVEEIPISTQVKLLRSIEEKEITRLGDTKPRRINVSIISSSIEDLREAVKNGKFRQDLYFRLNTFNVKIPSLRHRKEDIPLLVRHFLKQHGVAEKKVKEFERKGTLKRFVEYGWPGNVRELENEIKRMVVLAQAGDRDPCGVLSDKLASPADHRDSSEETSLFSLVAEFEKERIIEALRQTNWIKLRAARLLGIPEATIRNKMKKHNILAPV
ncbi:MAG: sigma 54-interacting transcriptional regulator [Candidatus Zixiibacteriota bacterium]|nr:MAG: sigma 54-interacting transcriptional regulator [candidate division Zixibacteria bacterium]